MPEPLRWDTPSLRWDSPGLRFYGYSTASPKAITQDLLQLDISDEDWSAIDAALLVLETKLAAKLIDLDKEERSRATKMGPKSETFTRQSLVLGRQFVAKLPTDTASDLALTEEIPTA